MSDDPVIERAAAALLTAGLDAMAKPRLGDNVVELTEMQYSDDRKGPWTLYIYDEHGMHGGRVYFQDPVYFQDHPKYPEEGEITTFEALTRCILAVSEHREVRVCDGGDMLVYRFDGERVLHGENFWNEVCPERSA